MTLNEAIEVVLREERKPLKASEIAHTINSKKLYLKGDNTNVTPNQIRARASKYPEIFIIEENGIALHDLSIKPYRDFVLKFTELLKTSGFISDTMKIQELAASFLFLIYYAGNNIIGIGV